MSQKPQEQGIILDPSEQSFNRRDFLKRSSIIPAAGALSVVGGSALLLAPMPASAVAPDAKAYEQIGSKWISSRFDIIYGNVNTYMVYWRSKNPTSTTNDWVQIWYKITYDGIGTTRTNWEKFGEVGNIRQSSGKRVIACYNALGKQIAFIPAVYLECAAEHGRRLAPNALTSSLFPPGSYARGVVTAKTFFGHIPQFTYVTYIFAGKTYYRFVRFARDIATGYVVTEALESVAHFDDIKRVLDAMAEYDKAVLSVMKTLVVEGAIGAGVGMGMALTDASTGVAAYGLASVFVIAAGVIPNTYFTGMNTISEKNVQVTLAMSRFNLDAWTYAFQAQCPSGTDVRI